MTLDDSCINQLILINHETLSAFEVGLETRGMFLPSADIRGGAPQVSILAAFLFLIYANRF